MIDRREALFAFGVSRCQLRRANKNPRHRTTTNYANSRTAFDFIRARKAKDYAIATPSGIDEAKYLKIGSIEQWVTIRGQDRANPVVLVLHGGPGDATAETLTIDRLVQDGVELADALRMSLRKDKIILLGHSWGSVLGVLMAKKKPDMFPAFVGTGQVGNPAGGHVPQPGSQSLPRKVAFNFPFSVCGYSCRYCGERTGCHQLAVSCPELSPA